MIPLGIAYSILNSGYSSLMKANWRRALAVVSILLISGCSQVSKPEAASSSTPTVSPTASIDRGAVYTEAAAYLQSFLDSWQKNGLYVAAPKYLDPSMRPNQKQGNPVLIAGTVASMQPYTWVSADNFTVMANLNLRFSKEDGGAWGNGINTRFVTFVRSSASALYQITFATGP